jgi:hypothetical protein
MLKYFEILDILDKHNIVYHLDYLLPNDIFIDYDKKTASKLFCLFYYNCIDMWKSDTSNNTQYYFREKDNTIISVIIA